MTRKFPPAVSSSKTTEHRTPEIPRRFARAVVDLPAEYAVRGETEWHTSVIDNLGGGGVRLQTHEDVAAGTVVSLRFEIDGNAVTATARVAMSLFDTTRSRYIHGVAFTAIDPEHQRRIVERVGILTGEESA